MLRVYFEWLFQLKKRQAASQVLGSENPSLRYCPSTGFIHMGWYGSGVNDPSAGSPTETLLRLLLPLNDKVQATSRR